MEVSACSGLSVATDLPDQAQAATLEGFSEFPKGFTFSRFTRAEREDAEQLSYFGALRLRV